MNKKWNYKQIAWDFVVMTVGNFLLAVGVQCFVLPHNILSGGVAGIAVALHPLTGWSPQMVINVMVIGMFLLGLAVFGKSFILKTAYSSFCYPAMLSLMATSPYFQSFTSDPLLASIYGGLISGIGVGLVLRIGASTGGMDIPPLIIAKYTHSDVSKWILVFDTITICLGLVAYNIEAVLIGMICVFCCSKAVNTALMLGSHDAKSVQIISDKYTEIKVKIHDVLSRGSTLIPVQGGYTNDNKTMILVVVSKNQYPKLNQIVHQIDPNAFMIVTDTMDVKGEGFTMEYRI